MAKSTVNKRDFIEMISKMSHEEINKYILEHGKPPKIVRMYHLVDKEKYTTFDEANAIRHVV